MFGKNKLPPEVQALLLLIMIAGIAFLVMT